MGDDALSEAYARLEDTGPEWGKNQLSNHGPMASKSWYGEAMPRASTHGWTITQRGWRPCRGPTPRITDASWQEALRGRVTRDPGAAR